MSKSRGSPFLAKKARRRRRVAVAGALIAAAAIATLIVALVGRSPRKSTETTTTGLAPAAHTSGSPHNRHSVTPARFFEHRSGSLSAPVQDASAVAVSGGQMLLLGGLNASDTSIADIRLVSARGERRVGLLPVAVHDAAAVRLGSAVYVFGGGTNAGTQSDAIVRVSLRGQDAKEVGRLPAPSSDQAAAAVGGTAYIVGGYTGTRWLNTVVAWKPGSQPHVVARLPFTLRYAAVTAVHGTLIIAGGSLENGAASSAILAYRPGRGVSRVGRLPAPTTHAAAATLGGLALVIGGRGAAPGSVVASIISVDPSSQTIRDAGRLKLARSDLATASFGTRVLLGGGRDGAGALATLSQLAVSTRRRTQSVATTENAFAFDGIDQLRGAARFAKPLVYVPNSQSASVDVIDPRTFKVVERFGVGLLPQHVVPSYDLKTLYVTNDVGNSLTMINPRTGKPGRSVSVADPYNMYFTPDGRYAIVVAERLGRLDFRNPHTFALHHTVSVPCSGVDHMDFAADGRYLIASCEFSGQLVKVDVVNERVAGVLDLPDGRGGMPQDVRISPNGKLFYVADLTAGGVWKVDGRRFKVVGFIHTGSGAHGLYPSRDGKELYVSNRSAGSVSVISFGSEKVVASWQIPGNASPDMGGVSADGTVLWLSGRYNSEVYAISTRNGRLLARVPVGTGPHGLCVWPQPGRYSLGHTDDMR